MLMHELRWLILENEFLFLSFHLEVAFDSVVFFLSFDFDHFQWRPGFCVYFKNKIYFNQFSGKELFKIVDLCHFTEIVVWIFHFQLIVWLCRHYMQNSSWLHYGIACDTWVMWVMNISYSKSQRSSEQEGKI